MNLAQCIRGGDRDGRSGFLIAFRYDLDTVEALKNHVTLPESPLSTKVSKGDLPAFPAFNDKWEAPVQSEWFVAYLELAKLGMIASGDKQEVKS